MRIVAGQYRGRKLQVPEGLDTRPTSDRVKEATFNALYSLDVIEDINYIDLFAGSGALGLEALSRGAKHVTFIETSAPAVTALRANIETLKVAEQCHIIEGDALTQIESVLNTATQQHSDSTPESQNRPVAVLADPPYDYKHWPELLDKLAQTNCVLIAETPTKVDIEIDPNRWELLRNKQYGTTTVTIAQTR